MTDATSHAHNVHVCLSASAMLIILLSYEQRTLIIGMDRILANYFTHLLIMYGQYLAILAFTPNSNNEMCIGA